MARLQRAVLSFLGTRCQACGAAMDGARGATSPLGLCADCRTRLLPRLGGYCPLCGEMVSDPAAVPQVCGHCRREPPPWSGLAFFGPYTGLLRDLLTGFKFNSRLGLGRLLQGLALEAYELHGFCWERPQLVIPVPLHVRRLTMRGFNQSLETARLLARELGVPLGAEALRRCRSTRPQVSLPARDRRLNVQGAFAAREAAVLGREVLLVDDIMTTGGTLRECARTLRQAGAAKISVLVVARTVAGA